MTLCIAAECEYKGKPVIAMCADWRSQTGDLNSPELMTGSDDAGKIKEFGRSTIMLAGVHGKAIELAAACKPAIQEFTELDVPPHDVEIGVTKFMQELRKAATARKRALIQNFVENSTGIAHSEFINLPTGEYMETWHAVRNMNLGADILISHVKHEAVIVRLDRWGEPHWENNYGVIGNGAEIARAMMCLSEWSRASNNRSGSYLRTKIPLEECIFRLQEAHTVAHQANPSSVGEALTFQILGSLHRASVEPRFNGLVTTLVREKHRVPTAAQLLSGCSQTLNYIQVFSTGKFETTEPEEL